MNVKTTVVLLVLLVIGVVYAIVFHTDWIRKPAEDTDKAAEKEEKLLGKLGDVRRLVLEKPGARKIVLVKADDKWRLTEPVDAPAATWPPRGIVAGLREAKIVRRHAPDDKDFPTDDLTHLSAPLRIVTLTDDKDRRHIVRVGQIVPMESRRTYVQLAGDEHVYVVDSDLLKEVLDKDLSDFRDKNVVSFDTDQAVRLEVRGDENYQLVKVEDKWALDRPVSARADQDKAKDLLRNVSNISAEAFIDEEPKDLAAFGLAQPRLTVTVELKPPEPETQPASAPASKPAKPKKGKVISIAFGAPAGPEGEQVFAKLGDQAWVFQVRKSLLKDLQPKLLDLRDKRVLDIAGKEATKLEIWLEKGGSTTLEKVEGDWRMVEPFKGPADESAVIDLIALLRDDLKAEEFQDDPKTLGAFGLEPAKGRIVMHFRGSEATTTLLLGASSGSGQMGFVRPADVKSVAVVPSAQFAKLLYPSPTYWTKRAYKLPEEAQITRVDLDGPERSFTVAVGDDDKHTLTRPVRAPADTDNVKALLEAVKEIQADKIVSLRAKLPERFAKAKPIRLVLHWRKELPPEPPASQPTTTTAPASGPASRPAGAAATAPASGPALASRPATAPATRPAKRYRTGKSPALLVAKDKGKAYVWVQGASPLAVGELSEDFHDKVAAEMRDRTILKIDAEKVVSFKMSLAAEKVSLEFRRAGDVWQYTDDTFVKVDADKLKEFFETLSDVKAQRFVDYSRKPDPKRFGLENPAAVLEATTRDGKAIRLHISRTGPVGEKGHYAVSTQVPGVFVLGPEAPEKMKKDLKDFRKD